MLTASTIQALSLLFEIEYGETRENPFSLPKKKLSDYQVLESLACNGIIISCTDFPSSGIHSFRLVRPYSSISLLEVIRATGGTVQLANFAKTSSNYHCERNMAYAKMNAIDYSLCRIFEDIKISSL